MLAEELSAQPLTLSVLRAEPAREAVDATANPCLSCTIGQDCCSHLSGLRVSRREFDRCFAQHEARMVVGRDGPLWVVSALNGGPCPNWSDRGCSVYEQRPMECRLFPYTIYTRSRTADSVSIAFHSDTRCPLKDQLRMPRPAAKRMIAEFCRDAFPPALIEVRAETWFERLRRRLRDRIRAAIRR